MTTDIVQCLQYLRPTTLVEVIYDLEPYAKYYGELLALVNAATRELVNNAGEAEARKMLAEKGLALVATFTVRQGQDSL